VRLKKKDLTQPPELFLSDNNHLKLITITPNIFVDKILHKASLGASCKAKMLLKFHAS
jgi:hypothetical protein